MDNYNHLKAEYLFYVPLNNIILMFIENKFVSIDIVDGTLNTIQFEYENI